MVILEEQGLRDGIQNLEKIIPVEIKIEYANRLVEAGIKRIQLASFVHPKLVPQMADAEQVIEGLNFKDGVVYSGLVLNLKGVQRAAETKLKHLSCSVSASNTHSQKNVRKTLAEAKKSFEEMVRACHRHSIKIRGGIQCAFGCRYEGKIDRSEVYDLVKFHLDKGIDELALADSTGMANPKQISEMLSVIKDLAGELPLILHLHNTESKGLANLYSALDSGVKIFDTAFGGLGGCPFIKNASGNIATEDSAHMLQQMGYNTGIDLMKLKDLSLEMEKFLGYKLQGRVYSLLDDDSISMN